MRTGSAAGSKANRWWQTWMAVIAVVMGATAATPAQAGGSQGEAPAAAGAVAEVDEAKQLLAEARRLDAQGRYEEAIPFAQRALAIREKALGSDHPSVAAFLNGLALLYWANGDYARAEPAYQHALTIQEKALGPDHTDVALSLINLAMLYRAKGDGARGEPLAERALAIQEKALGPDHTDVAATLANLALLYKTKGDYTRAEVLQLRALGIREQALGPDHLHVAASLNNLAELYRHKGDPARAELLHERALKIQERTLGPDHPHVAASLNNLADLCASKGDFARAEALFLRALAIKENRLGTSHPGIAASLNNLAALYFSKGDFARAEPLYQRALSIKETALGPDHPAIATSLNNLALLHKANRDYARAEPLYQRAAAILEASVGPGHPDVAAAWSNLSALHVAQGRPEQAVDASRRSADIQDRQLAIVLAGGSEEQKRLYMSTLAGQTYGAISLHVQHAPADSNAARLAMTTVLRRKGRILDAMTDSLAALRRSLAPADRELLRQLAAVYSQLGIQASRGPGKASAHAYRKHLAELEQARHRLEAQVGERSAAFRAEQQLVALPEVQAAIPEGAALVEIARYAPFHLGFGAEGALVATRSPIVELDAGGMTRWSEPRYVAYVLRREGDPTFADLGDAAELEAAVDTLRCALADHDLTHDPKPAARALDRLLMQPIRKLLGDTRWVVLSPDGPLHLVPFGALVDEQGRYLVERYLFSYLSTGRDPLRFAGEPLRPREAALILANPAFDVADRTGDTSRAPGALEVAYRGLRSVDMVTQPLGPLASTVEEASRIARLFPDSRVLLGAEATEQAVKAARAPRLLHLATHGFFLPEQPVPDELLRRPGAELTPAERAALLGRENPLLRSGIALAGFNARSSGDDDGVLTALEAAGLDLHGTRLVVLSACETGVGQAVSGEGVYGLRRALVMAGAETLVMSLWQVDTGRTRELMQAYYERLEQGAGRSDAMRRVQLAMLADPSTAHPNLWASFIVSGDWRALEALPRMPDIQVHPGSRGCACSLAGERDAERWPYGVLAFSAMLAITRRRHARGLRLRA